MAQIANIRGRLTLTIGDAEAVHLGDITIPIETSTHLDAAGRLILTAQPNMREVRESVQAIFDCRAESAGDA